MKKLFQESDRGFTLIELLVVVAIIGILAAMILASLGSARAKARLARGQSELSSMRAAMELFYSTNGTYAGGFDDDSSGMKNLVTSVESLCGNVNCTSEAISSDGSQWAYSFAYGNPLVVYCADSNGYSGKSSGTPDNSNPKCTPM